MALIFKPKRKKKEGGSLKQWSDAFKVLKSKGKGKEWFTNSIHDILFQNVKCWSSGNTAYAVDVVHNWSHCRVKEICTTWPLFENKNFGNTVYCWVRMVLNLSAKCWDFRVWPADPLPWHHSFLSWGLTTDGLCFYFLSILSFPEFVGMRTISWCSFLVKPGNINS